MDWKFVDTQADLDFFDQSVCWDDSNLLEFCGTGLSGNYFPHDISYSAHLHLHILYDVCSAPDEYLHLVLICCNLFDEHFLSHCFMQGRVDSLKRVEVYDWQKSVLMRCARMIYRFLPEKEVLLNQPYLCRFLAPPEY